MDLEIIFYVLFFTFVGSLLSLLGGALLLWRRVWEGENSVHLLAFAAGVLLATAFLDLLPESLHESGDNPEVFLAALGGIVVFFFLERFLIHFHPHSPENSSKISGKPIVSLILVGDGLHNFIDGFVIATSFLVSIPLGITTTIAVAAHEIPQEISDFTILLKNGVKPAQAIVFNIASGLAAIVGAILALVLTDVIASSLGFFLAFTAGMFVYIGGSSLIPELQHLYQKDRRWHQAVFFVVGILAVYLTIKLLHPQ